MIILLYFFIGTLAGLLACMALSGMVGEYGEKQGVVKRNKGH